MSTNALLSSLMKSGFLSGLVTSIIVSDDKNNMSKLAEMLRHQGIDTLKANDAEHAEELIKAEWIDLAMIDITLPEPETRRVCRLIRRDVSLFMIPIVMFGEAQADEQAVDAMRRGADDVITLDISTNLLTARIKSLVRRSTAQRIATDNLAKQGDMVRLGRLTIIPDRYAAFVDKEEVDLTLAEHRVLTRLATHPNKVFSRRDIIETIHGENEEFSERSMDTRMSLLRRKLGKAGNYIRTVRGVGYQFRIS